MERVLGRYAPYFYAALRFVAGMMFMMHGTQKLFGTPGGRAVPWGSLAGVAGMIEAVAGLLIALGLFGSIAAFIASGEMAFAYFLGHAGRHALPIVNQGELAVLYCFIFLYVAARGSGVWSVDSVRGRTPSEPAPMVRRATP